MTDPRHGAEIALDNVRLAYGDAPAVDNVSLCAASGELCCLLGPSGCGKSTTLRLIAGLEHPDNGAIRINGRDVTSLPARARGVGLVFQNYALFPHMTVFENAAYGLRRSNLPKHEVRKRAADALAMVRLTGYEARRPHELSGGERQRAALARSLAPRPEVLLLDEPLSNLDAGLRTDMRDELAELQRALGLTMVFVTHDREEAMTLADRIVLMRRGRIVQTGPPRELYERPDSLFAASFMGKINILKPQRRNGSVRILGVEKPETTFAGEIAGVRPEHVCLAREGEGAACRVEETVFTGPLTRYRLRLEENGERIDAERPASEPAYAPGEKLRLSVETDRILAFPDEEAE